MLSLAEDLRPNARAALEALASGLKDPDPAVWVRCADRLATLGVMVELKAAEVGAPADAIDAVGEPVIIPEADAVAAAQERHRRRIAAKRRGDWEEFDAE